jgi:superfamily II DNA or RNA helicase
VARSIRLRLWQKQALDRLLAHEKKDFLAVATPGAGKTTFALTAARHHLADHPYARVIVVVPTMHLKHQWASAAANFDLHLEPEWSSSKGRLPSDMHGIVATYAQVATSAELLAQLSFEAFVILDEIHHAGDERAWGDGISKAFATAARRLSLSGTPFRSDTRAIPFVHYDIGEEASADFEYGYGEALRDNGVVRPIHFPRIGGEMEWIGADGTYNSADFDDALDSARVAQRLRTALSLQGQWMPTVLDKAHSHLMKLRETHSNAGGLVIAMDQEHARGIAQILEQRHGAKVVVATSDDPTASRRIARFSAGDDPWIVAVRMVSEGVDIPRLRLGVFATNTVTELFFRQAIGRLVRYVRGVGPQPAYLYLPDDPRLKERANQIREARRHSLRKKEKADDEFDDVEQLVAAENAEMGSEERVNLFEVLSAKAVHDDDELIELDHSGEADDEPSEVIDGIEISLAPAPVLAGGGGVGLAKPLAEHKSDLRGLNADRVRDLVQLTGLKHAAVNKQLNEKAGVVKVTEATTRQLERRLRIADAWLSQLTTSAWESRR